MEINIKQLEFSGFCFDHYSEQDKKAILDIETQRQNAWSTQQMHEYLDASLKQNQLKKFAWVLRQDETCIAYCLLQQVLDEADLLLIVVNAAYRKKGFGEFLLTNSLECLKHQGMAVCFLDVRASNISAQALYSKLNFKKIAVRKNYYALQTQEQVREIKNQKLSRIDTHEDAWLMKLAC